MKLQGGSRGSLWQRSLSRSSDSSPIACPPLRLDREGAADQGGKAHLRSSLRWPCLFLALAFICSLSHLGSSLLDCVSKQILSRWIAMKPNDALACSIPLRGQAKGGWSCPPVHVRVCIWGGVSYLEQRRGFRQHGLMQSKKRASTCFSFEKKNKERRQRKQAGSCSISLREGVCVSPSAEQFMPFTALLQVFQ